MLCTQTYQEPGNRPRQTYHLTEAGRDLRLALAALQQWGDHHRPRPSGPSIVRRMRSTSRPVHVGFLDDDGHEVPGTDVAMPRDTGTRV